MRDQTQKADHLNTAILYYRRKNISSRLYAEFYQSRLLKKVARRDPDLLTCMVSLRLTNRSLQRDSSFQLNVRTTMHWLSGLTRNSNHYPDSISTQSPNESDIPVSYDVSSLFTNLPLGETIQILVEKAFTNNWLNLTHTN